MKYLVIHGYYEVDGIRIFNSLDDTIKFLRKEKDTYKNRYPRYPDGWFYQIYHGQNIIEVTDKIAI